MGTPSYIASSRLYSFSICLRRGVWHNPFLFMKCNMTGASSPLRYSYMAKRNISAKDITILCLYFFEQTSLYISIPYQVIQQKLETGNLKCSRQNFTYIWYSFLTKAQPFTLYYQFELFSIFYIPEMTFLVQKFTLPSKFYKVYILYQFSPNFVSVRSICVRYHLFPKPFQIKLIVPILKR